MLKILVKAHGMLQLAQIHDQLFTVFFGDLQNASVTDTSKFITHVWYNNDLTTNCGHLCCREHALSLVMTAADLSAVIKPWPIQCKSVKFIYEEFYVQVCALWLFQRHVAGPMYDRC